MSLGACSLIYDGEGLVGPGPDAGIGDGSTEGASDANLDPVDAKAPVVVGGQTGIAGIAIDATYLYWTTEGGNVTRRKREGATADEEVASAEAKPGSIAVDASHVYWTATKAVRRRALGGGPIETVATTVEDPVGLTIDSHPITIVFWTEREGGFLKSTGGDAGQVVIADKLDRPTTITRFTNKVFVILGEGQVHSQQGFTAGIGLAPNIAGRRVTALAGTSSLLYFSSESSRSIASYSATTNEIEDVLPNVTSPSLASDGGFLYFVESDRTRIRRLTL